MRAGFLAVWMGAAACGGAVDEVDPCAGAEVFSTWEAGERTGIRRGQRAADVTLPVFAAAEGDPATFQLSAAWTGCDSFLFLPDRDQSSQGQRESLWDRDLNALFAALPARTHVVFFSEEPAAVMPGLRESLGRLEARQGEDFAPWASRIHLVDGKISRVGGWVGEKFAESGYGFLVGPDRRIRDIGSLADPSRRTSEWFESNVSFAANEVHYAIWHAGLEARLAAEADDVEVVTLIDSESTGGKTWLAELPPLEGVTGAEIELVQGCGDSPREFGTCPAWDYLANLYVCGVPDETPPERACQPRVPAAEDTAEIPAETRTCGCTTPLGAADERTQTCQADGTWGECPCACEEIARWVTTYHREGHWVHDITDAIPRLGPGGSTRFRLANGNTYVTDLRLRLRRDAAPRPTIAVPLWRGGRFDEAYNDGREAITVDIPASAKRVELHATISGHGFGNDSANCAEFCNHIHTFTAAGQDFVIDHPWVGDDLGCVKQVPEGVVANQFGTWFFGRGGWCAGQAVPADVIDLTAVVTPGQPLTLSYRAHVGDEEAGLPQGGGFAARIDLESRLVVYE